MADGFSTTFADDLLNTVRGTAYSVTTVYAQLHKGAPGAAGTANQSAVTTRVALTFNAASGGSMSLSNTPQWAMTATETITDISIWDASTAGNFLWSVALTASKSVNSGDTLQLNSCTFALTPIAA